MKKADNFNPAKWLVENKLTSQSKLNENKEFNIDFPSLDYNTVVDFIESKGYDIVSDYYDKGFDADEGDTFVGIFDDHIEVMDPNGRVKKYRYTK
jgi:hypothetical protein